MKRRKTRREPKPDVTAKVRFPADTMVISAFDPCKNTLNLINLRSWSDILCCLAFSTTSDSIGKLANDVHGCKYSFPFCLNEKEKKRKITTIDRAVTKISNNTVGS